MSILTIGNMRIPAPQAGRGSHDAPVVPAPAEHKVHPEPDSNEALSRAIEAVNRMLDPLARGLQFSVDGSTGKTIVKLVDKETGEVLREMPSREMLAIARALDRVQGVLFKGQA